MDERKQTDAHVVNNFNSFVTEYRAKIETLLKQLLLVSGGIQTITISAFLGGTKPSLSPEAISQLQYGWVFLSASIILCLALMLMQVIALAHVTNKKKTKIEENREGTEVMNTWPLLICVMWLDGLSAFASCVAGVIMVSKAAITLIGGA